jgi:hypothetical protein
MSVGGYLGDFCLSCYKICKISKMIMDKGGCKRGIFSNELLFELPPLSKSWSDGLLADYDQ